MTVSVNGSAGRSCPASARRPAGSDVVVVVAGILVPVVVASLQHLQAADRAQARRAIVRADRFRKAHGSDLFLPRLPRVLGLFKALTPHVSVSIDAPLSQR